MLYWEYRQSRTQQPTLFEWGGPQPAAAALTAEAPAPVTSHAGSPGVVTSAAAGPDARAPRMLVALAALHARLGALPWEKVLQPAIDIAKYVWVTIIALVLPDNFKLF